VNRQRRESLADYVKRTRTGARLSLSDVERQSSRSGHKIAGSYVSRIENGVARNPSKDKLVSLAKGLGVSEEEVFAVARGKSLEEPSAREQKLLAYFRELPRERQEDFMRIIQTLHREHSAKPASTDKNLSRTRRRA
jgi:transcriptional regulator with XRE-family HTH domain